MEQVNERDVILERELVYSTFGVVFVAVRSTYVRTRGGGNNLSVIAIRLTRPETTCTVFQSLFVYCNLL